MELETLRRLLEEIAENGKSARYPVELKEAAVAYFRARQADGIEARDVARELGMVLSTLMRWNAVLPSTESNAAASGETSVGGGAADEDAAAVAVAAGLDERAARFRDKVAAAGIVHGRAYPRELRQEAVAYLEARKAEGVAGGVVAEELGVSWEALARWQSGKPWRPRREQETFRPVMIEREQPTSSKGGIVVHAGSIRVEGLDVGGLAELIRRLG